MPKISEIMTKDVVTVTPQTSLRELAQILSDKNINGAPVVDDQGAVLGVVCESDLVNQNKPLHIPTFFVILDSMIPMENPWKLQKEIKRLAATTVEDIYSKPAATIKSTADVSEAAKLMQEKRYYTIPVVDEGTLVGIVGKGDLIRAIYS